MSSFATRKQQPPVRFTHSELVESKLIDRLNKLEASNFLTSKELNRLLDDVRERSVMGEEGYKTKLYTHNGRCATIDAYQEALDLCFYLEQEYHESKDMDEKTVISGDIRRAVQMANSLRTRLSRKYWR